MITLCWSLTLRRKGDAARPDHPLSLPSPFQALQPHVKGAEALIAADTGDESQVWRTMRGKIEDQKCSSVTCLCLSVCLSVYLSVSVCLSVCLFLTMLCYSHVCIYVCM